MTNRQKRSVVVVDVRILDTFEGAQYVKQLEETGNVNFVFAVENPNDRGTELETHGIVISNAGRLTSREFWEAVFEQLDNGLTEVVAVAGHYNHWQSINVASEYKVPFKYVYNLDNRRMVWL